MSPKFVRKLNLIRKFYKTLLAAAANRKGKISGKQRWNLSSEHKKSSNLGSSLCNN